MWLTSRIKQRSSIDGHLELGRPEYEEFPPSLLQEDHLVSERQAEEGRDILGPLDRHEEDTSGRLAQGFRIAREHRG